MREKQSSYQVTSAHGSGEHPPAGKQADRSSQRHNGQVEFGSDLPRPRDPYQYEWLQLPLQPRSLLILAVTQFCASGTVEPLQSSCGLEVDTGGGDSWMGFSRTEEETVRTWL